MPIVFLISCLVLPALLVHTGLYGWHRAPLHRIILTPRQWTFVGSVAALPFFAALFFVLLKPSLVIAGEDRKALALLGCAIALVSIVYGLMPSHKDDD